MAQVITAIRRMFFSPEDEPVFLLVYLAQAYLAYRPAEASPEKRTAFRPGFFPGANASAGTGRRKSRRASPIGNAVYYSAEGTS